jgi:hypothetical protein
MDNIVFSIFNVIFCQECGITGTDIEVAPPTQTPKEFK